MKYAENIERVAKLGPDYMGFIFYRGSKRYVGAQSEPVPEPIKKTGVFVNTPLEEIIETIHDHDLDAVQLHGEESPAYCSSLREVSSQQKAVEIIKVFSVGKSLPLKEMEAYLKPCDYFLFDTKGTQRGGTGRRFDWSILEAYRMGRQYFLSGGIGLEHLEDLTGFLSSEAGKYCCGIDLNSKFEKAPAVKYDQRLKAFMEELIKTGK